MTSGTVTAEATSLFPRFLDIEYPEIARGQGLWLETSDGRRILDAGSRGGMVSSLRPRVPPYLAEHLHIPPSTELTDPTGEAALEELDRLLADHADEVAAFFCEPVSAAALPGYSPPDRFWEGLAERRERYGFLVCFDEVVTGIGRTGTWIAAHQLPIEPDIVAVGKGLGAGHAPLGAVLCRQHVYDALDRGSKEFDLGHTWDGAPLSSAVGLAVIELIAERGLVDRVQELGPKLLEDLRSAVADRPIVGAVRGRGFLLGVELVDPRDRSSFLPVEVDAAALVDDTAFEHGLLVTSTHPQADGFAGDQVLLAPAFNAPEYDLAEMVERLGSTLEHVERLVLEALRGNGRS